MIEWVSHESTALKNFPMGDSNQRQFPVYLPPDYDSKRKEPYPVIYILAGYGSKGASYIADDSAFGISLPKRLDQKILNKKLSPVIAVFPDCSSKMGGSQYINSPSLGNYSDYLCDELPDLIEKKFNAHRNSDFRGLMGHSSGGFGALINGMTRSDRFSFICSSAGDSFFEVSLLPLLNQALIELERAGSLVKFLEEYLCHPSPKNLGRTKGEAMMLLAMAPCYAPDPSAGPLFGKLFFDLKTGAIIPEIWNEYLAWDPVRKVEQYAEQMKKLKYIHLCSGLQDEYCLQYGQRQFSEKLKKLGIHHEFEEYSGGHSGQSWRFESRITRMVEAMYC